MLIDFEFSCYNYRGFDFGNHFIERMYNNHSEMYPYFEYDFSKYPSRQDQLDFVRSYITQFKSNIEKNGIKVHTGLVNLNEESILHESNLFALIALHCTVPWTVFQAAESSVKFGWLVFF